MADPAPRQVEDDRVGRRVVAGLADQLDGTPASCGGEGDARRHAGGPQDAVDRPGRGRADDDDHSRRVPRAARELGQLLARPWAASPAAATATAAATVVIRAPGRLAGLGRLGRARGSRGPRRLAGLGRLGRPGRLPGPVPSDPAASSPSDSPSLRVPGSRSGPGWSRAPGRSVTGCPTGDRTGSARHDRRAGRDRRAGDRSPAEQRPDRHRPDTGQGSHGHDREEDEREGLRPHRHRPATGGGDAPRVPDREQQCPGPAAADRGPGSDDEPWRRLRGDRGHHPVLEPRGGSDARLGGQRLELASDGERVGQLGGRRLGSPPPASSEGSNRRMGPVMRRAPNRPSRAAGAGRVAGGS